jgi:hypothetical protein
MALGWPKRRFRLEIIARGYMRAAWPAAHPLNMTRSCLRTDKFAKL